MCYINLQYSDVLFTRFYPAEQSLEQAGISNLADGQAISYEESSEKGKVSAVNLKLS